MTASHRYRLTLEFDIVEESILEMEEWLRHPEIVSSDGAYEAFKEKRIGLMKFTQKMLHKWENTETPNISLWEEARTARKHFYDNLTNEGYQLEAFSDFETSLKENKSRKKLFNNLIEDGYSADDLGGDFDTFSYHIGIDNGLVEESHSFWSKIWRVVKGYIPQLNMFNKEFWMDMRGPLIVIALFASISLISAGISWVAHKIKGTFFGVLELVFIDKRTSK